MKKRAAIKTISFALCAVAALSAGLIAEHLRAERAQEIIALNEARTQALLREAVDDIEKNCMAAAVLGDSDVRSKYCCRAYSACRTAENCFSTANAGESVYLLLDIIKEECLSFGSVGSYSAEIAQLKEQLNTCGNDYSKIVIRSAVAVRAQTRQAGAATVSEDEAKQIAADFSGIDADKLVARRQTEGAVPCFTFVYEDACIYVSREHGRVRLYICDTMYEKSELERDAVLERAENFLEHCKCEKTQLVSEISSGGLSTFVFACVHSDVSCLNETIKITVSEQTGKVVFYDSTSMLINCRERTLPKSIITPRQAANALAEGVEAESSRLVFINDTKKREKLCFELTVKSRSQQSLVYVDAVSGETIEKGENY